MNEQRAPRPASTGRPSRRSRTRWTTSAPARSSSSSTTPTARTRATSSSPRRSARPRRSNFMVDARPRDRLPARRGVAPGRAADPADGVDATARDDTAFTVSIDYRPAITTGTQRARPRRHRARRSPIPASDRRTSTGPATSSRCAPRRAACCGAPGHTEAAVDLARSPGCSPAGVICEVMNEDGTMARLPELVRVAPSIRPEADLDRGPDRVPAPARGARGSGSPRPRIPTECGDFRAYAYDSTVDGRTHVALVLRRHRRRREGAHPGALRVPHRRRVRVAALRLRPPARRGAASRSARRAAASSCTCAGTRAARSA